MDSHVAKGFGREMTSFSLMTTGKGLRMRRPPPPAFEICQEVQDQDFHIGTIFIYQVAIPYGMLLPNLIHNGQQDIKVPGSVPVKVSISIRSMYVSSNYFSHVR